MAKKSVIERNEKRKRLTKKFAAKRERLKALTRDNSLTPEERFNAQLMLAELPRNSSPVRVRLRCELSGRGRGNYRKFREDPQTGRRYVHTIDPLTGFTRDSNILAVSVIAPTCMVADGYATAFMAMDLEASRELLDNSGDLEAYIIYLDAEGNTREFVTEGFRSRIAR